LDACPGPTLLSPSGLPDVAEQLTSPSDLPAKPLELISNCGIAGGTLVVEGLIGASDGHD
jgi:hypothetical protein